MRNPISVNAMISATLARGIEITVLAALFVTLPLSPIAVFMLSGDRSYVARYLATMRRCAGMFKAMRRHRVIQRNLPIALNAHSTPPEHITGQCTHCGRCCIDQKCVFLALDDHGQSRCRIYGNWYWQRTNCGKYPQSGRDIQVYDCPSYSAMPMRVVQIHQLKADAARPVWKSLGEIEKN
jgi:hypothetical protein